MYRYEDIKTIDLELTERCNAACPMCPRNFRGSSIIDPRVDNSEIRLEDAKRIFTPDFLEQLNRIELSGDFGDPVAARDCLEIVKYFKKHNVNLDIQIHTNGGIRTAVWWEELAKTMLLGSGVGQVVFGIDGLQDTNHIYRQHVNWKILERSIKSFIGAGGKAQWQFIKFKHNQHQVEEARALAKAWGFASFNARDTTRFYDQNYKQFISFDSINKKVFLLEPPDYQNEEHKNYFNDVTHSFDNSKLLNKDRNINISCYARIEKSVHITAKQTVYPCCHTYFAKSFDAAEVSLKTRSLKEILNSNIFDIFPPTSWKNAQTRRNRVCINTCDKDFGIDSYEVNTKFLNKRTIFKE